MQENREEFCRQMSFMREHLNVVYITDGHFENQCGVSLNSLLRTNAGLDIDVYILEDGISETARENFNSLGASLHFIPVKGLHENTAFQEAHGFQPIVYTRLLLTEYLPESVNTVLYIDADTVVDGPLEEIAQMKLSDDTYIAAVPELYMPAAIQMESIGFQKSDIYYNAGVLLINLHAWRTYELSAQFMDYLKENQERLRFNDQDIINACCKEHVWTLLPTYNMNPSLPWFPTWFVKRHLVWGRALSVDQKAYQKMLDHPSIIHYMGDERPWITGNYNYYRSVWEQWAAEYGWQTEKGEKARMNWYLLCYRILNGITRICPWVRITFTCLIGIHVHELRKSWNQLQEWLH